MNAFYRACRILTGTFLLTPSLVLAQQGPAVSGRQGSAASDPDYIGEIVVLAQGRAQRLKDVPISASIASGTEIKNFNLTNLQEITASIPSVFITPGPAADNINIRGVGSGDNAGFEQSVSTFVDGAYRGRGRTIRAALLDVERIEVLKGPQTTFFGNNAIAGAFNIVTRKPGRNVEYNASSLYAPADGEYALEAGASLPASDTLAIRLAGKVFGSDGYTRNRVNDKLGPHLRDFVGRASVRWEANPDWEIDARVDYGRDRDTEQSQYQLINCPPPPQFGSPRGVCANQLAASGGTLDDRLDHNASVLPSFYNSDFVETALTNRWKIDELTLRSITTYSHHDFEQMNTVLPVSYPGVGGTPFVHNVLNTELANLTIHQFSENGLTLGIGM